MTLGKLFTGPWLVRFNIPWSTSLSHFRLPRCLAGAVGGQIGGELMQEGLNVEVGRLDHMAKPAPAKTRWLQLAASDNASIQTLE